jgi:hypothetical protein
MISTPENLNNDLQSNAKYGLVSQWEGPPFPEIEPTGTSTGMPPTGAEILQMLLAKPNVHGVVWNQFADNVAHPFANSGLINAMGSPRNLLSMLGKIRQAHVH